MRLRRDEFDPRTLHLSGRLTSLDNDAFDAVIEVVGQGRRMTLDMADLEYVDSFGIGLLLVAGAEARARGGALTVRNLRGPVARVFHLSNLDSVLPLAVADEATVAKRLPESEGRLRVTFLGQGNDGSPVIGLAGRFTFADHEDSQALIHALEETSAPKVTIDLDGLELMDTTGLSLLLVARQSALSRGVRVAVVSPRPIVARLLDMAQLQAEQHGH